MVDAMAPVFDRQDEEEAARVRLRRGESWPRDAQAANAERGTRTGQDSLRWSDANRKLSRDGGPGGDDDGDDDSDDDDNEGDAGPAGGLGPPLAYTPPEPLTILTSQTAPALLRTSEAPTTSSTSAPSILPQPGSSVDNPAAVNPQLSITPVVTVSSVIVLTTTTSLSPISSTFSSCTETSSLFDCISPSSTTSPTGTLTASSGATAAFDTAMPSPTIFLDDSGDDLDDHRHDDHGPPPGGLSPTAEDVLISAGSIGAFILVCFVCWMGWRMYKKSKRAKNGLDDDEFSSPNALLAKIPYFRRNQRTWQDLDGRGSPPMYESSKSGIYPLIDEQNMTRSPSKQVPTNLPQLNTNVSYANVNPFSASSGDTYSFRSAQSPQSITTQNAVPYSQQSTVLPSLQTSFSPASQVNNPFALPEDASFEPNSAAQYGAGTMQTFETVTSDRSRMPDPIYNQSELARQASTAYDPARRNVYRASELSSISSGFGDGDIIVPLPAALQQGLGPRPPSFAKSVATRSEEGSHGQRDTVYTTTSEDMPTRYRSVNSWVNQQTGRIQRQQQSAGDEDVPPVPSLPAEERYTMMMDDEEPRRYEDTISSQPPVPTLPSNKDAKQQP